MEEEFKNFGDRLRERRTEQKITLQELAERSKVPDSTISEIEMGLRPPSRLVVDALIRALIALGDIKGAAALIQQYLPSQGQTNAVHSSGDAVLSPAEKTIQSPMAEGMKQEHKKTRDKKTRT